MRVSNHIHIHFGGHSIAKKGGRSSSKRVSRPKCDKLVKDVYNRAHGRCKNTVLPGETTCGQCHSRWVEDDRGRCTYSRKGTLYCGVHGCAS